MNKVFKDKKIAILGFGREGRVLLGFLKKEGVKFSQITICDKGAVDVKGVAIQTGEGYLKNLDQFDVVFKSPGIPTVLPEIQKVLKRDGVLTSPTNLFFDLCKGTIVGVTGTKGKGTTATMLYNMLRAAKKKVFLLGNIGRPALEYVRNIKKGDVVIMELSSFQLQHLKKSPHIAIVLDVTVDHLDHHKNVKEYRDAKMSIVAYQKRGDVAILDADSPVARSFAKHTQAKVLYFGNKEKTWITSSDISVPGAHNIKNASAAALAAEQIGVSREVILKGLKNFKGNEHRLEFVREKDGVRYYNDSAATNPDATIAALRAFVEPKILIIGGRNKGFSYAELAKEIQKNTVRGVILLGETKKIVFDELEKLEDVQLMKKVFVVESLSSAVNRANVIAQTGDVVIYSPSATSFDMFHNYEERGEQFKQLVLGKLKNQKPKLQLQNKNF
ncbi:MAG: UDP-N-acetylmuramoyl-L-alanine--D-glutamate ligase [Parcubacteria group bacterium]|nr:UDP-N-acetylmuramoyl-L-alanine--D-glutamate ligase [Parcubacteria group bacterium]